MGRNVDFSPSSSTEVQNEWHFAFVPPIYIHGMKKETFTYLFYLYFGNMYTSIRLEKLRENFKIKISLFEQLLKAEISLK